MPASTTSHDTAVSSHPRYRYTGDSMRVVTRREPTLALHVHVGIARRQAAIRVMNGLRVHPAAATRPVGKQIAAGLARAYCEDLPFEVDRRDESPSRAVYPTSGERRRGSRRTKVDPLPLFVPSGDDGAAPVMSSWGP